MSNAVGQVDSIPVAMKKLANLGFVVGMKSNAFFHFFNEHLSSSPGIFAHFLSVDEIILCPSRLDLLP
jgi:hypothetical protein